MPCVRASREPGQSAADPRGCSGARFPGSRHYRPAAAHLAIRMKTIIQFYGMYRCAGHGRRASIRIAFYRFQQHRSK
jgi:hypothetical protein